MMEQVNLAMLGMWELVVVLLIVMVIFGAGKLPKLGEGLGKAIRNFRQSTRELTGAAKEAEQVVLATPQALKAPAVMPTEDGGLPVAEENRSEG
jgi:sec-independent protein translocase protein TatA